MHQQTVLFDLDGTLTDPRLGITRSIQYALAKLGIDEPDLTRLEHFIGPPLLQAFMQFYGFDEAKAWQAVNFYRERFKVTGLYARSPGCTRTTCSKACLRCCKPLPSRAARCMSPPPSPGSSPARSGTSK